SIEPTASARPPGHHTELLALGAERLADIVELLSGEWACTNAGGVGLADAKHVADGVRPETRAGRGLRCHRVGGRHEWGGAVVDVEQGALRTFEQDSPALTALVVEQ